MTAIDQYRADWVQTLKLLEDNAGEGSSCGLSYLMSEERYLEYRTAIEPVLAELTQLSAALPETTFHFCHCAQCAPSLLVWWTDGPSVAQVKPRFEGFSTSPHYYASFIRYRSRPNDKATIDAGFLIPRTRSPGAHTAA